MTKSERIEKVEQLDDGTIRVTIKESHTRRFILLLAASVLFSAIGMGGVVALVNRQGEANERTAVIAADTNAIVRDIERRQSPEAQARQEALLDSILLRLGCDNRAALTDVLTGLMEQGILEPGSLEVAREACEGVEPAVPTDPGD